MKSSFIQGSHDKMQNCLVRPNGQLTSLIPQHTNSYSSQYTNQNLPGNGKTLLSYFKVSKQQPDFGKRKPFVWYDFQAGLINLAGTISILGFKLLINGIVYPQVYITSPMPFLLKNQHVSTADYTRSYRSK